MAEKSEAEQAFLAAWVKIMPPGGEAVREHRFHPTRMWRFDFCWPSLMLAVEIQGRGRHQTVTGYLSDCEKLNEAQRLGWDVLFFTAPQKRLADDWAAYVLDFMTEGGMIRHLRVIVTDHALKRYHARVAKDSKSEIASRVSRAKTVSGKMRKKFHKKLAFAKTPIIGRHFRYDDKAVYVIKREDNAGAPPHYVLITVLAVEDSTCTEEESQ